MANAHLRIIVTSNKEANAKRVIARLNKIVKLQEVKISPYHKGGFEVISCINIPEEKWNDQVFAILEIAQKFGRGWTLHGHISKIIDLSCTDFSLSGLEFANIILDVS